MSSGDSQYRAAMSASSRDEHIAWSKESYLFLRSKKGNEFELCKDACV